MADPSGLDSQPPSVPSGVAVIATTATDVQVTWTASTDTIGVTGYNILRREGGGFLAKIASSVSTSFNDSGLTTGTTYYYAVQSYDADNNTSANSAEVMVTVLDPNCDQTPPTTPTNLHASVNGTNIELSWTASTDNVGIYGYTIYQSTRSGGPYTAIDESLTTSYTDETSAAGGGTFYYVISAVDTYPNESGFSNEVAVTIITVNQLVPQNLMAKASSRSEILLTWLPPDTTGTSFSVTGYRVQWGPSNLIATVASTTYTVTGLTADTAYAYWVRSVEAGGQFSRFATTTARTLLTDPVCGNGAAEGLEYCDGNALAGESCSSQGFSGGTLYCSSACTFDTSSCTAASNQQNCTADWVCTPWSTCSNGTQTRTCTDRNGCGMVSSRPYLSQNCTMSSATTGSGVTGTPPGTTNTNQNPTPPANQTTGSTLGNTSLTRAEIQETVQKARARMTAANEGLVSRLLGHILLQVEDHGEAWYIDPIAKIRFYLANGPEAYQALRQFGLGITDADILKIPVGRESRFEEVDTDNDLLSDKMEEGLGTNPNNQDSDGDGFWDGTEVLSGYSPYGGGMLQYDEALASRLLGRIVIQTEKQGQAWYINPVNGKRYYMKDGEAAYQIMRFLSLGITNNDLDQINIGDITGSYQQ